MSTLRSCLVFVSLLVIVTLPINAHALWQPNGATVISGPDIVAVPSIIADGAGGAIVVWGEKRNGEDNWNIYAQRMDASGAQQWPAGGVAICTATGRQDISALVSDGAGGAIITWEDERLGGGSEDVYAQRIDASGSVLWTTDGVAIVTATSSQIEPAIASDGAGGAIIAWYDTRNGPSDIYAQRVNASGVVQWATDGVPLTLASGSQAPPVLISDGAGGAVAAWADQRSGDLDIYAQRINGSGVVQWTSDGVAVFVDAGDQELPRIAGDGTGGVIAAWADYSAGGDVYAQRVHGSGALQWASGGVPVCAATGEQGQTTIAADGTGGAVVAWLDDRSGGTTDVYAQRIDGTGAVQWATDGVGVVTGLTANRTVGGIIPDDTGGAIVTWEEFISNWDVRAQRVDGSGTARWATNGFLLSSAPSGQNSPVIATDGWGGAIVAWEEPAEAFAQHVSASGVVASGVTPTKPPAFRLGPNTPNPFSSSTSFDLVLSDASDVTLEVYDVFGRRVRALTQPSVDAGCTQVTFDGRDRRGKRLSSGVYFCRVTANGESQTRKIVIAR